MEAKKTLELPQNIKDEIEAKANNLYGVNLSYDPTGRTTEYNVLQVAKQRIFISGCSEYATKYVEAMERLDMAKEIFKAIKELDGALLNNKLWEQINEFLK